MSSIYRYLGSKNYPAAFGANVTINLAQYVIGGVAADPAGRIPPRPTDSSERGIQVIIDNTLGSEVAYLATPAEITAHSDPTPETIPFGALVVNGGQRDTFGPFAAATFRLVLRLIDGAQVNVSIAHNGAGYDSSFYP